MPVPSQRIVHQVTSLAPPVRGLNTTGPMAAMPPSDALEMDNFIATDQGLSLREGWYDYAVGLSLPVRTILSFEGSPIYSTTSPVGQSELFAATDAGIYNIEGGGDMTDELPVIALSGAPYAGHLSVVQFTTDGGKYLIACSETDGAFLYDGVGWIKMIKSDGTTSGPGVIDGKDPAMFVQVCAWKARLMFVERGGTVAWILPVGQVGGTVDQFNFGPLFRFGGMLLALVNWTQDAGQGIDDYLVVLSSSGDLLVYSGTDPTDANSFSNQGTWYVGRPPVGRRCFTTIGGNVMLLTIFGVIPVTQVVQGGLDTLQTAGTEFTQQLRKIQGLLSAELEEYADSIGWEITYFPSRALLHIARPATTSNQFIQYAFQEHNLAWSRLFDVPAITFGRRLNEHFAGTDDGRVLRVFSGNTDGKGLDGLGAHEIRGRVTPAFSYFGDPSVCKQALMSRVRFLGVTEPGYAISMNADFHIEPPRLAPALTQTTGALWDAAFWDRAFWTGSNVAFGEWRSVEGIGNALAPTIYVASEDHTTITSIEHMIKSGGPL